MVLESVNTELQIVALPLSYYYHLGSCWKIKEQHVLSMLNLQE